MESELAPRYANSIFDWIQGPTLNPMTYKWAASRWPIFGERSQVTAAQKENKENKKRKGEETAVVYLYDSEVEREEWAECWERHKREWGYYQTPKRSGT